jgi:hypothetical protein
VPKYNVSVSFSLRTEIEPEGVHFDRDYPDGVEDIEDVSYWRRTDVDADGGNVTFTVTADSEQDAETISEEIIFDGMEVEDDSGFTWVVDDRDVSIEKVEIPMDLNRATSLVQVYLSEMEGMDDDLKEAFGFLLDLVVSQEQQLAELLSANRALLGEIDRLRNGPDGSEATDPAPEPQVGEVGL